VDPRGGGDDAVGHRELVFEAEFGSEDRDSLVQFDDRALTHQRNGLQRRRCASPAQHDLEHRVEAQGGDDELIGS
jgi:hypothetical protein